MDDFIIRLIRHDELKDLLKLYEHFNHEDSVAEVSERVQSIWDEIYNNPNLHYIVAEYSGMLVSTCTIAVIQNLTRNARPYGLIENVVTHTDYRNMGLGKQVLNKAVEIATLNACYKVMLLTGSKDEKVLNFYRGAGFSDDMKTGFLMKLT